MAPIVAAVPRRPLVGRDAHAATHFLEFSSTAWLASAVCVGGGDAKALALLPSLEATTQRVLANDDDADRADEQARTWALSEAYAALRAEHAAQHAARARPAARVRAEPLRRTTSNELIAMLYRELAGLKNALRSMLVNDAVAQAVGATDAQVRAALVTRCGELMRLLQERCPESVDGVGRFLRTLEPAALTVYDDGERFAVEYGLFSSHIKLADFYLHLHAALGAHATARDALLASLGATPHDAHAHAHAHAHAPHGALGSE